MPLTSADVQNGGMKFIIKQEAYFDLMKGRWYLVRLYSCSGFGMQYPPM